jgi:hypothetical protein
MGKSVSHGPVGLSGINASERAERRFADNDTVIQSVREWIRRQPKDFFEKGIRMLPESWKNVLTPEGSTLKTDMCK